MDKENSATTPVPCDQAVLTAMIDQARQVREQAYAPYSRFRVGAALLGVDGGIYTGCNVENATYGLTNCAERTAVFKAVSAGCRQFQLMVLTADGPDLITPCGACRQVLAEFAPQLPIVLTNDADRQRVVTLDRLLPDVFTLKGILR
ncbi:MAG: cytidine deaminase [Heliobacteriaceae bacterium]|nr:cytidine deaminase [Heliobacteriaceae bacterium]MDD4586855.1 cytidine deaminase [Heliobacteriaceae bacterium]